MNILLLGKSGQIGWELQRSLAPLGTVTALDRSGGAAPSGQALCGDLTDLERLAATVRALRPGVIVSAAAHTAVDKAESEPDLARTLNAQAPGVLAREAAALGAWLVHYSTDYVFNGSGNQPWVETDATGPLSVYGHTKLEGEQAIAASGCKHLILRTSWVYAARGGNFAKTMIKLAQERERLTVINDQFGSPTGADLLADVTAHAIRHLQQHPQDGGLYHCVAGGDTTWHAYASHVIQTVQRLNPALVIKATDIAPVPSSAFATAAKRPHNSRLNTAKLQSTFGLTLPHWRQGVDRMLREIC